MAICGHYIQIQRRFVVRDSDSVRMCKKKGEFCWFLHILIIYYKQLLIVHIFCIKIVHKQARRAQRNLETTAQRTWRELQTKHLLKQSTTNILKASVSLWRWLKRIRQQTCKRLYHLWKDCTPTSNRYIIYK